MKLKFLVDSLRSTEKNFCGLKVFENQNLNYHLLFFIKLNIFKIFYYINKF